MSYLNVTEERPDQAIRELLSATIRAGEAEFSPLRFEGEYPTDGFGVSELRPRHVGIARAFWQMTVTTSFADWINDTEGTDAFRVVTGLLNMTLDPSTAEVFPSVNGKDLPRVNVEPIYADRQKAFAWFSKPYACRPSNNITIQAIGRVAQTERQGLLGYAVAKRSYLIAATP